MESVPDKVGDVERDGLIDIVVEMDEDIDALVSLLDETLNELEPEYVTAVADAHVVVDTITVGVIVIVVDRDGDMLTEDEGVVDKDAHVD